MKQDLLASLFDNTEWAMTPKAVEQLFNAMVLASKNGGPQFKSAAVDPVLHEDHTLIKIAGPIVARHSFFNQFYGCTSLEWIADAMLAAEKRGLPVKSVFSTDGGEAKGHVELADLIGNIKVPVHGYTGTQCLSAGFTMFSQCTTKSAHASALLGSFGIYASRIKESKDGPRIEIVKGQFSKNKNNASDLQSTVNAMEDEMLICAADGYGIDKETVIKNFGQGSVFTARQTIEQKRGMVTDLVDNINQLPTKAAEIDMKLSAEEEAQVKAAGGIGALLAAAEKAGEEPPEKKNPEDKKPEEKAESDGEIKFESQDAFNAAVDKRMKTTLQAEDTRKAEILALDGAEKLPKLAARCIAKGYTVEESKELLADAADLELKETGGLDDELAAHDSYLDELEGGTPEEGSERAKEHQARENVASMAMEGVQLRVVGDAE